MSDLELDVVSPDVAKLIESLRDRPQRYVVCKSCNHRLADADQQHTILGGSEHEFVNPHGVVHRFRCYKDAPGCTIVGKRQAADTWFYGYTWRVSNCGQCDTFIGWLFESEDSFFGLLVDKIFREDGIDTRE